MTIDYNRFTAASEGFMDPKEIEKLLSDFYNVSNSHRDIIFFISLFKPFDLLISGTVSSAAFNHPCGGKSLDDLLDLSRRVFHQVKSAEYKIDIFV